MFRHLTPAEQQALTARLAARGVTPEQFEQAKEQARAIGEALARAYGEAIGRPVTPVPVRHRCPRRRGGRPTPRLRPA